ncbi:hypothetical protein I8G32_01823 [Rhodopseudomonas palustris]|uniref:Phenylacetic acid degradation-related protein n=2 Tax=Rhodopseudomonas palustris (strain ATCC BAA-98 / CGA009) TaxID=258594 RepID=Q6N8X2_RHOPA|nr:hypothetical protein I8G32_01823 [Rhodopseudomonas palustris]CAE27221.1 Phenylacetic acid degradation-related protein [Rhodopseudomonas palustris CGA009]
MQPCNQSAPCWPFQTPSQTALQTLSALPAMLRCGLKVVSAARQATTRMTTDPDPNHTAATDGIPDGFVRHARSSPLTAPWEPLYAKTTADAVTLGLRIRECHTNSRGLAHGGLITALADNAMGYSCGLKLGGGGQLLTSSLAIDFIGPAKIGQWLQIEPEVIKLGAKLCVAQCFVTADGTRCARANGTFSVVKAKE